MMKTAKDLELSLLLKEKQIQDLKLEKINIIENGCEGHNYYEYDYILEILKGEDNEI